MDAPALRVIKMSRAGTGATQVSVNRHLLYLFIIAIKKNKTKPKRGYKKGSGEQPGRRGAVRSSGSHYRGQAWEDVTAGGGAFQPQRDACAALQG